jgi:hypothetical protein
MLTKKGTKMVVKNKRNNKGEDMPDMIEEVEVIDSTEATNVTKNIDESSIIDRDEEDRDVLLFQKTGDLKILEKLYKNRVPTLRVWTNKHYYPGLTTSIEDLFSELSCVFVKAARKYDATRGNFNTCLFTFLLNRIKNLKSSKYAKKRTSEEYSGPLCGMILSLDFSYNDKDGSEMTLKDIIPGKASSEENFVLKETFFNETLNILAQENKPLKDFFVKISQGGSLTALLKEYKTRKGKITIKHSLANKLNKRKSKNTVAEIIRQQTGIYDKFKIVDYKLTSNRILSYEIELKRTEETDNIMKNIRDIRRNKNSYISRISGLNLT